jgi:hypothetical protein
VRGRIEAAVLEISGGLAMNIENEWTEELERRGVASVVAMLSGRGVGVGRGAEFKLFTPGMPNPSRGFVEDWVGHKEAEVKAEAKAKEAEAKATGTKWNRYNLALGVLAIVVAIVIAWWFK